MDRRTSSKIDVLAAGAGLVITVLIAVLTYLVFFE